jgi:NADH-quinone oxidoreductase subunit N
MAAVRDDDGPMSEIAVGVLGRPAWSSCPATRPTASSSTAPSSTTAFARFMKVLVLIGSMFTLILSQDYMRRARIDKFEFPILVLLSTLGMCMLVSANDLIALYLGLELMSLALYVVAAFHRDNLRATEAGLKYFVLGALSSGMLLYGASLVYGFTGTVSFAGIVAGAIHGHPTIGLVFGSSSSGRPRLQDFGRAVPHVDAGRLRRRADAGHRLLRRRAQGRRHGAFTRVIMTAFPGITPQWQQIVVFISIASMALGAFAAIGQTNIKRLMAYSSIGHMGFALVGLAAGTQAGVQGVAIYMAIYVVMTLGTFAVILSMRVDGKPVENIADLAGLARTNADDGFFLGHA